jgi:hypothetical protein
MSIEGGIENVDVTMSSKRTFPQYTLPFASWEEIAQNNPDHLEVRRFMRQPEADRANWWYRRCAHAHCDVRVPPEWGLGALYLRHEV